MTARKTSIFALVLAAGLLLRCSVQPDDLTDGKPDAPSRIAMLEREFHVQGISRIDKMRIAAELLRLGVRKPAYRDYLEDEIDRALEAEERADDEWSKRHNPPGTAAVRAQRVVQVSTKNAPDVVAFDARLSARPPDATNLVPMVMRSMTAEKGDLIARDQLRRALNGGNVLLSAEAALGLARVKDKESIPDLERAAARFDQPFLFGRALLYFGEPAADEIAKRLLKDDALVRQIHETAKLRSFDPYYRN